MDPRRDHYALARFRPAFERIDEIAPRADPRFGIAHCEPLRNK
jgi:hypothetical protein